MARLRAHYLPLQGLNRCSILLAWHGCSEPAMKGTQPIHDWFTPQLLTQPIHDWFTPRLHVSDFDRFFVVQAFAHMALLICAKLTEGTSVQARWGFVRTF